MLFKSFMYNGLFCIAYKNALFKPNLQNNTIKSFLKLYTNQHNKTALIKPCFVNLRNAK